MSFDVCRFVIASCDCLHKKEGFMVNGSRVDIRVSVRVSNRVGVTLAYRSVVLTMSLISYVLNAGSGQ